MKIPDRKKNERKFFFHMTLTDKIKAIRIGQTLRLRTESERTQALNIAKVLGLRIVTRARKQGGFTVTRLPE